MSYKLVGTLKNGEKLTLNNVGDLADYINDPMMTKIIIKGYFAKEFKDKLTSLDEIKEIKHYKGRKLLNKWDYTKAESLIEHLMRSVN